MGIAAGNTDGPVLAEPVPDRYRHIRFLSDAVRPGAGDPPPRRVLRSVVTPSSVRHRPPVRPEHEFSNPEEKRFLDWLLDASGVDPTCYRAAPLKRRLAACLRGLRVRTVVEARQRLLREPRRIPAAISSLLIGVTQFFREPDVFAYLDAAILPTLQGDEGLRVWSVGCADGAELYSVAMLLARRGMLARSTLLGTDCREEAIHHARQGRFDAARLDGLSPEFRQAYLIPHRGGATVCEELRQATSWQRADAIDGCPTPERAWDLILCRNLAIYLEPAPARRLWNRLAKALRSGGVLITGKAERPQGSSLVRLRPCVYGKPR